MLKSFSQSVKYSWRRVLACLLAVIAVISLLPVTAMADFGDTGGYNPGSPGGQTPTTSNVAWSTNPDVTFLRFTLVEFPRGVVIDLNTSGGSAWRTVGTPLNVVWGSSSSEFSANDFRSNVTWYDSSAMLFNGSGANAAQLMGSSVTAYSAASGNNSRRVITADEFQSATGITNDQKEQMFHLNSGAWSTGWLDGDYTSLWGTDPHPVTPDNLYKIYTANAAFIYLLGRLSETGGEGTGWSPDQALANWTDKAYDSSGNLRTKYRIVIETGGIFTDPDGINRAYTLREAMAYSLYNNEADAQYNLIWDQAATLLNMTQWMRQAKEQFVEYPLNAAGTPTGEELRSTNGFREADSFVDSVEYSDEIRSTIFAARRSYGLHILNPFNFESPEQDRSQLTVTKTIGGTISAAQTWGFTVTYTAGTPISFTAAKNGADFTGEVTQTGSGLKFRLKGGETINIIFEAGDSFRCQVSEDDPSLLTNITGTGGAADRLGNRFTTTGSSARVTFTNTDGGPGDPDPTPTPTPTPTSPPAYGRTILYKRDARTNVGAGPATFKFSSVVNGTYEFNTNANGELEAIQWWDPTEAAGRYIKPGEYTVTELVPPPNYTASDEVKLIRLELDADGNPIPAGPLVFSNLAKPGLRIVKYDRLSHRPMSGVTFDIYRNGAFVGRHETNANGEILLNNIEPGTYRAVEVDAGDDSHIPDASSYLEVELEAGGGVRELVFFNDLLPGLRLLKVDSADPARGIPGAVFEIKSVAGDYGPVEFTTGAGGEIDLSHLPEGSYIVTEKSCPGYVIDDAQRVIYLRPNDTAEFVFTNTRLPSLRLVKTSVDGSPLDGVTFRITPIGDAARSLDRTTQNGGEIMIEDLEPGVYSIMETSTLPDHILDRTEYHVELSPGRTSELRLSNDRRPSLTIRKTDKDTGEPVPGVIFTLRGADGHTITTRSTGPDGTVTVSNLLPGVYTVSEQSVPESYILDITAQMVTLFPNLDAQVEFQNHQRPTLKIAKVDINGRPLPGAIFEVTTKAGVKIGGFPVGADGTVIIPNVQLDEGYYIVTEIQAPEGYILDSTPHEVYLRPGKTTEISIVNDRKPSLTVNKVDHVTGEPIEGVKFQIWRASDGTRTGKYYDLGVYYTDAKGQIHLERLDTGWYKIKELETAPGYVIKQPDTQEIYLAAGQDRTLVFENTPKSKIIVQKYDSVTHEPLPGCLFQLRQFFGVSGTEGTVISQKVTGEDGTITWTGLTLGAYIVQEVDAADGYHITNASETVYLADDGEQNTVTLLFTNDPDGSLLIRKVCSVNPSVTLQDAEFKVLYADGSVVGNSNGIYRTDENGEILITGLTPGKSVVVTETRAPDGFILNTQSQTIQIKAGRIMTLTFKNQPRGNLIIQKRDSITGKPLPGAQFRVTTAAGCEVGLDGVIGTSTLTQNGIFVTDAQGEIKITNLAPGAYVLSEVQAPAGYVMDAPSTHVVIGANGDTQTVIVTNTPKGSLIIEKYDSVTRQPLPGARFKVTTASGELVADNEGLSSSNGLYTTNENGQIILSRLLPNTYVVTEDLAPDNYRKDPTPQAVVVNAGDTQTLRFYDDPLCTLTILKRDAVTGKPLQGAEFTVRDSEGKAIGPSNGIYTTGSDGAVTVSGLAPNSTVVVSESKAPSGYVLDQTPQHIVVRSGVLNSLTFDDQPTATLIIHKYIEGTNNEPLAGVAFKVVDGSGAPVGTGDGTFYTDAAGEIVIEGLNPGATITAWEIKTAEGFVLDGTPRSAQLQAGQASELTFWNKQAGTLVIQKKDSVSGEMIPGAQFQLTYASGGYVDNDNGHLSSNGLYTTDANGEIRISGIVGTVVAKEVQPAPGYVIDQSTQTQTVTVNPMDTQTLTFLNDPLCSLAVTKLDSVTGKPVPGTVFEVKDGSGNVLGRYTTGSDGTVTVTGLIPGTTYVVTEVKVPDGYILDPTPQTITVTNGRNTLTGGGSGSTGNGLVFEDDPTVTLTIHKYIEGTNNKPLAGVAFKVTYGNGAAVGPGDGIYYTNAAGEIVIEGLEPGATVTAREIKTVDGFVLDGTPKTVKITAGSQAPELVFWNARAGELVIRKLDSVTRQPLAGVEFELTYAGGGYVDTANGHLSSNGLYTTDAHGEIHITGVTGTIVVKETRTIDGYTIDEATQTQTVTVNPMDTQVLTFYNAPKQTLTIQKYVDGTTDPLQGVAFLVTDSSGAYVGPNNGEFITDKNGQIVITGLTPGVTITAREVRTVSGYVLDSMPQSILIKSGAAQTMTFFNKAEGGLELIKVSESDSTKRIPGVTFEIRRMDGALVTTVTTGSTGRVHVDLDAGDYYAVETVAAQGFKLDSTPHYFTVQNGKTTTITVKNKPFSGILIHKTDSVTGQGLYGVTFLLYDSTYKPVGQYTSDNQGYVYIEGLTDGSRYYLRELENPGYIPDTQMKTVYVMAGETTLIEWKNTPITAQIQITKKSADYNPANGLPAGTLLEGAVFEIYDKAGNLVDAIRSDSRGVASSKPLPLGRYTVREVKAPANYGVSGQDLTAYLEYAGEIVRFEVTNKSLTTGVSITKTGPREAMAGQPVNYTFSGIANASNVMLTSFYWRDTLPADVRLNTVVTGTYNFPGTYKITYRVNGGEYRTLADNLSTNKNYTLAASAAALGLASNERVTEIMFVFGQAPAGFAQVEAPMLKCTAVSYITSTAFTNIADVGGVYNGQWVQAVSRWVTTVYRSTVPSLPKTGY